MPNFFLQFGSDIIRIRKELINNLELLKVEKYRKSTIESITTDAYKEIEILKKLTQLIEEMCDNIQVSIKSLKASEIELLVQKELLKSQQLPKDLRTLRLSQLLNSISENKNNLAEKRSKLRKNQNDLKGYKEKLSQIISGKEYVENLLLTTKNINPILAIDFVKIIFEYFKYDVSYLMLLVVEYSYSKKNKNTKVYDLLSDLLSKRVVMAELEMNQLLEVINDNSISDLNNFLLKLRPFLITNQDDVYFDLLLFITIRQTSPHELNSLLEYQRNIYQGDFKTYVKTYLPNYRELISESHFMIIEDWISKEVKTELISNIDFEPIFKAIAKSKVKETPEDFKLIPIGTKTQDDIKHFFSFLYEETNGDDKPFMSKADVEEMLQFGFGIYKEPRKHYAVNVHRPKGIIKYCFFKLYSKLDIRNNKNDIAIFLTHNFECFKEDQDNLDNFKRLMNKEKPKTMNFDIESYLP